MKKPSLLAALILALIEAAKQRFPDFAPAFDILLMGVVGHFGGDVLHTLKNGAGNGNGKGTSGGSA